MPSPCVTCACAPLFLIPHSGEKNPHKNIEEKHLKQILFYYNQKLMLKLHSNHNVLHHSFANLNTKLPPNDFMECQMGMHIAAIQISNTYV